MDLTCDTPVLGQQLVFLRDNRRCLVLTLLQNRPSFQAICPGSLWARDNRWLLSRVQRLAGSARGGGQGLLSRLETPTGTKWEPFVPVGVSNRDKRPMSPLLARLVVGPGTKATYCPGPKGCRDKWPGTKACFVVVFDPRCGSMNLL